MEKAGAPITQGNFSDVPSIRKMRRSISTFQTITQEEFQKRKAVFEAIERDDSPKKARSLQNLAEIGLRKELDFEFDVREKQMETNLKEIHEMVVKMQKMTEKVGRERPLQAPAAVPAKMASVKDFDETTRSESRLAPTSSGNSNKKYKLKCIFTPKLVPLNFSVTIFLYINSTRKKFVEEIRLQSRYVPARYCQKIEIPVQTPTRRFVFFLFVECSPTKETVVELKPPFIH